MKKNLVKEFSWDGYYVTVPLKELESGSFNIVNLDDLYAIGIFRLPDSYVSYDMVCPHHGGNLADGECFTKSLTLQCPWHGYVYDLIDGNCIKNPNLEELSLMQNESKHFKPISVPDFKLRRWANTVKNDVLVINTKRENTL